MLLHAIRLLTTQTIFPRGEEVLSATSIAFVIAAVATSLVSLLSVGVLFYTSNVLVVNVFVR